MTSRRHLLTWTGVSGLTGLLRLIVLWLVLACLAAHGIGVNLIIGALVRISPEETTEESKCEIDLREAACKCVRVRFIAPRRERTFTSGLCHADGVPHAPRPPAGLLAPHLIGAGIRVCC